MIAQQIDTAASIWVSTQQQVKALEALRDSLRFTPELFTDEQLDDVYYTCEGIRMNTLDMNLSILANRVARIAFGKWSDRQDVRREQEQEDAANDPYRRADDYEDDLKGGW